MLPLIGTKKIKNGSVNAAARIIKQDWDKNEPRFSACNIIIGGELFYFCGRLLFCTTDSMGAEWDFYGYTIKKE